MKWIKFILLILCLSTFQSNFSQAIGIRTLTPVNKDVERPKYDTTFIYFDLSKLEDNPHYYDNQEILFSPCIDTVRYYDYFGGFFTKDSVVFLEVRIIIITPTCMRYIALLLPLYMLRYCFIPAYPNCNRFLKPKPGAECLFLVSKRKRIR